MNTTTDSKHDHALVMGASMDMDQVFAKSYVLRPLGEVAAFVGKHQHLPGVPSAQEMVNQGMDGATLNAKLLEKVEELTLYLISQQKQLVILRRQLNHLTH